MIEKVQWVTADVKFDSSGRVYSYAFDGEVAVGDLAIVKVASSLRTVEVVAVRKGIAASATKCLVRVDRVDITAKKRQEALDRLKEAKNELKRRIGLARKGIELETLELFDPSIRELRIVIEDIECKDSDGVIHSSWMDADEWKR